MFTFSKQRTIPKSKAEPPHPVDHVEVGPGGGGELHGGGEGRLGLLGLHSVLRLLHSHGVHLGVVWCGMVWYGMVWYGMVWYGMVWYGMVWYPPEKYCKIRPWCIMISRRQSQPMELRLDNMPP